MRIMRRLCAASIAGVATLTLACGEGGSTEASATPPAWVLASAPENPQSVNEAKAVAKEGDRIILRGRIGGRQVPISSDSPVFTVVDLSLPYCGQNGHSGCTMPWDYCCETSETIATNSATVQVVNTDGSAIDGSPSSFGFKPLDEVVVVGEVASRPDPRVLTIKAQGLYRVP